MIVYLDTNIVIYLVEQHAVFGPKVQLRLATAQAAGDDLMISDLTRMESLVGPLKSKDVALQAQYVGFFTAVGVREVAITPSVCDRAAMIRAECGFKPMDALQIAAAVEHGANLFLTNDLRLQTFTGVTIEVLT